MSLLGNASTPLRVAIIGSGPSGFYAAESLQKRGINAQIDMFERLPTPFGLVRGGVAPDHQKIKSVTRIYDKIASHSDFRFFGNVTFGQDITRADLSQHYHATIYAVGAQTDRTLGLIGEDLPGSHAATEFVGWYNGHPDYRDLEFDLSQETAVVIGVGNVAMDVARILGRTYDELVTTDIADYALDALAKSRIKTIYILGRRGAAQAAFTHPELKELGEMEAVDVVVSSEDVRLDELSRKDLTARGDRTAENNLQTLTLYAQSQLQGKPRQIILRFLTSPVEIIGGEQVEAVKVVKNELYRDDGGSLRPRATDQTEVIPAGLVFRSVGYRGVPLPDVPFYDAWGIIPNDEGRVLIEHGSSQRLTGNYVVGWIKRGPTGIIGTNKPDAAETVEALLEDLEQDRLLKPDVPARRAVVSLLQDRGINYVTYEDWRFLDEVERARGSEIGRPRLKFTDVEDMLDLLQDRKQTQIAGD
jgi:ferredoxin/flavodoxin---NADP+ reductase